MVGDRALRRDGGDALRDADRELLLPALQHAAMAAPGCPRAEGRRTARPHGRARRDERADAGRCRRRPRRAATPRVVAAGARALRADRVLRDAGASLRRRPPPRPPEGELLRVDLRDARRRRSRARPRRTTARRLAARPARHAADEIPPRRAARGRLLLAFRQCRHRRRRADADLAVAMSLRRLELLQWFGLLAAPLAWTVQLVVGFGAADANCARAGSRWGISVEGWMIGLTAAAATVAVCAELSAAALFRELRDVEDDAPGPRGRLHFFS